MTKNLKGAGKVAGQQRFEVLAPARAAGWQAAKSKADGSNVEARVHSAAAVEADFLRLQLVKIVQDAADRESFVVIHGLVKYAHGDRAGVKHQVLADISAGIRQTVGKLAGSRKQQEPRRFRTIGGKNYGLGVLQVHIFLFVEIKSTGGCAVLVHLDFVHVAVWTDFALTGFFRQGNHAGERT